MAKNRELRQKLIYRVFNTEAGIELLGLLYEEEVLSNKVFSKLGSLARQVGRSDLILEFFVYSEKEPKRRKEKSGVKMDDDKAVMEHHLKDNAHFFKREE
jgi:hypothetical protein